jgi:hypothetical protein
VIKKLFIWVLLLPFLSGCTGQSPCRVVTAIDVTSRQSQYHYNSPHKLEKFLYYLRALETWGPASLDELEGEEYRIRVTFSDGSNKIYRQKGAMCLAVNDGGWLKIDPDTGDKLPLLLEAVSPDG